MNWRNEEQNDNILYRYIKFMKRKKKISKKLEGVLFSRMELLLFVSTEVLPFTEHMRNLEC